MASVASVTVSIAEDIIGIFNDISFVSLVWVFTSRGNTCENAGDSNTSSNVKPSPIILFTGTFFRGALIIVAMCKDNGTSDLIDSPEHCVQN
jgi:hypothetical protein